MKLVIGSKEVSSWSLRPWLLLKQSGLDFQEILIPLYQAKTRDRILPYSASGKVPVLIDGDLHVGDSLAICEYIAEKAPEKHLWPADQKQRARARSLAAEMHSGFAALRSQLPMNVLKHIPTPQLNNETTQDIRRIQDIWRECLTSYGGPFLFGDHFTIADAMYAPVVTRFQTYSIQLDTVLKAYADTIMGLPAMHEWIAAAHEAKDG